MLKKQTPAVDYLVHGQRLTNQTLWCKFEVVRRLAHSLQPRVPSLKLRVPESDPLAQAERASSDPLMGTERVKFNSLIFFGVMFLCAACVISVLRN